MLPFAEHAWGHRGPEINVGGVLPLQDEVCVEDTILGINPDIDTHKVTLAIENG